MLRVLSAFRNLLSNEIKQSISSNQIGASFHTSSVMDTKWNKNNQGPRKFLLHNKTIFEPTEPDQPPRPAYVCHMKKDIKYSPKKLWYIASFIRGMTIGEAIKQLNFMQKKGAMHIKQVLLEAQELATKTHNVEFKSNLWIAESFCGKGFVVRGVRRHAKGRTGRIEYKHTHYFVRLEEGTPPEHYYLPHPLTPEEQLNKWVADLRKRKVTNSL